LEDTGDVVPELDPQRLVQSHRLANSLHLLGCCLTPGECIGRIAGYQSSEEKNKDEQAKELDG
jgi:hypothetical protein